MSTAFNEVSGPQTEAIDADGSTENFGVEVSVERGKAWEWNFQAGLKVKPG
jgi:hypothetical protein